ncbi:unnamed protein product [Caenorhabditis brenneri]
MVQKVRDHQTQPRCSHEPKVLVVYNTAYQEKRAQLYRETQALHKSKTHKNKADWESIDAKIDSAVIRFNEEMSRRREYELHWMTTKGAVKYVRSIMEAIDDGEPVKIITGQGQNSKGRVPLIRKSLMRDYRYRKGITVEVDSDNPGVIYLAKHLY